MCIKVFSLLEFQNVYCKYTCQYTWLTVQSAIIDIVAPNTADGARGSDQWKRLLASMIQ